MKHKNNKAFLEKTRTYLVGHMQYASGQEWRDYVQKELEQMDVVVYNPYKKPFVKDVEEDEQARLKTQINMLNGKFSKVADRMREIRSFDLNLVDRSDFIVAHIIPDVASWGSAEELVTAIRMKKPVFLSIEGGKKKTPLWIMGMLPHKYIYNNVGEIVSKLKDINCGNIKIDSSRWRLLKKELR
tara:strand:- start:8148 stop:8702 length:555 start_codon:yes stop_codon:yes gene_type:complete